MAVWLLLRRSARTSSMVNMDTGRTAGFRGEILPLGCPSPRTLLSSLPSCGPWFSFVWSLMLEIPQTTLRSILPTFQIQAQTILKKTFPNSLYLTVCARYTRIMGFPGSSASKESTCHVGDLGLIPGLGRSLEKGKATCSSILSENSMDCIVHGLQKVRHN